MIPRDTIVVVAGFGRCGTSLVLQMLQAGGADVAGTYPSFEDYPGWEPGDDPDHFFAAYAGQAIKTLGLRQQLPPGPRYKCIWINRDPKEQAMSFLKVKRALDPSFAGNNRATRKALALSWGRDRPRAIAKFRAAGASILQWRFEEILKQPLASAQAFASHLQLPLDVDRMAQVPLNRGPGCLPFILEVELMR